MFSIVFEDAWQHVCEGWNQTHQGPGPTCDFRDLKQRGREAIDDGIRALWRHQKLLRMLICYHVCSVLPSCSRSQLHLGPFDVVVRTWAFSPFFLCTHQLFETTIPRNSLFGLWISRFVRFTASWRTMQQPSRHLFTVEAKQMDGTDSSKDVTTKAAKKK